jgi:hypothetical protein
MEGSASGTGAQKAEHEVEEAAGLPHEEDGEHEDAEDEVGEAGVVELTPEEPSWRPPARWTSTAIGWPM